VPTQALVLSRIIFIFSIYLYFTATMYFIFFAGYSTSYPLDRAMVSTSPGGSVGAYGYWMQPIADGCTGLLFLLGGVILVD
jgi:hypothetical protein